jgi:hypothetical protein
LKEYSYVNEKLLSDISEAVSDTTILMMEKKTVSETSNASSKVTWLIARKDFSIYILRLFILTHTRSTTIPINHHPSTMNS